MTLEKVHFWCNGLKTLCGMSHWSTSNIGGLITTKNKKEVTCKKCIAVMKKWKWNIEE